MSDLAAVVLAGGAARRLGGVPKPALLVGGRPLLTRVLDAAAAAQPQIVVGPPELAPLLAEGVRLTQEQPPGGGPVAGLAAGVRLVPHDVEYVAALSADLPFLTANVLSGLSTAIAEGGDVAVLLDGDGRAQWLCAVWRHAALAGRLARVGQPAGARMRDVVAGATVQEVSVATGEGRPPPWFDCDTDADLQRARQWAAAENGSHADPR